jgi:hypothetical protein
MVATAVCMLSLLTTVTPASAITAKIAQGGHWGMGGSNRNQVADNRRGGRRGSKQVGPHNKGGNDGNCFEGD